MVGTYDFRVFRVLTHHGGALCIIPQHFFKGEAERWASVDDSFYLLILRSSLVHIIIWSAIRSPGAAMTR